MHCLPPSQSVPCILSWPIISPLSSGDSNFPWFFMTVMHLHMNALHLVITLHRSGAWLGSGNVLLLGGGGGVKRGAGYLIVSFPMGEELHIWGQVTSRQHVTCVACACGLETFKNRFCKNLDPWKLTLQKQMQYCWLRQWTEYHTKTQRYNFTYTFNMCRSQMCNIIYVSTYYQGRHTPNTG